MTGAARTERQTSGCDSDASLDELSIDLLERLNDADRLV
jgi:hypothetical protein